MLFAGNLKITSLVFGSFSRRKITSQECSIKCYPGSPVHKSSGQQYIFYKYEKYNTCISDSNFLSYFETITIYSIKEITLKSVKRVVSWWYWHISDFQMCYTTYRGFNLHHYNIYSIVLNDTGITISRRYWLTFKFELFLHIQ